MLPLYLQRLKLTSLEVQVPSQGKAVFKSSSLAVSWQVCFVVCNQLYPPSISPYFAYPPYIQLNSYILTVNTTLKGHHPLIPLLRPLRSTNHHPNPHRDTPTMTAVAAAAAATINCSTIRLTITLHSAITTPSPKTIPIIPSGTPLVWR